MRLRSILANPWGQPRALRGMTVLYVVWTLVPVAFAIALSFNDGRSRSLWQGFSTRWWWGDPNLSILHDPTYQDALRHTVFLAGFDVAIATPLGLLLALGLSRWRGASAIGASALTLVPLITPELVLAVSLFLVVTQLGVAPFGLVHLGTIGQVVGQITFSLSYVVVIVRGRLATMDKAYEEAAEDLGARHFDVLRLVTLPLLMPAIVASALIVFALSVDDFVITQYLSSNAGTTTIPMLIYADARGGAATPALNAIATVLLLMTLFAVVGAYLLYRALSRRQEPRITRAAVVVETRDLMPGGAQ